MTKKMLKAKANVLELKKKDKDMGNESKCE